MKTNPKVEFRFQIRNHKYAILMPLDTFHKRRCKSWGACSYYYHSPTWEPPKLHANPLIPKGHVLILTNNKYLTTKRYAKTLSDEDKEKLIKQSYYL